MIEVRDTLKKKSILKCQKKIYFTFHLSSVKHFIKFQTNVIKKLQFSVIVLQTFKLKFKVEFNTLRYVW